MPVDNALLARPEAGVGELAALAEELDDQALDATSGPGKWSIAMLADHVAQHVGTIRGILRK